MPAGSTYSTIATTTLGSNTSSYTFNSIPQIYTDLVLVITGTSNATGNAISAVFSSDASASYSFTYMFGNGTGTSTGRVTSTSYANIANINATQSTSIINFQNYSNATTYKTYTSRSSLPSQYDVTYAGTWRNTGIINSIALNVEGSGNVFNAGCTFTLYGIAAA